MDIEGRGGEHYAEPDHTNATYEWASQYTCAAAQKEGYIGEGDEDDIT